MSDAGSSGAIAANGQLATPEWRIDDGLTDYPEALATMEARAASIRHDGARELIWLTEHPPIYTAGSSAEPTDLLTPGLLPVFETGRGGKHTYHGPGQRVGYVMLDLKARKTDVRGFVRALEEWAILTLARFAVRAERREGRIGVWVDLPGRKEAKIAAIGVRVRRWVTLHGISLNIEPDMDHYGGIVPCGIQDYGVTSLAELGQFPTMAEVDIALRQTFDEAFGAFGFDAG